MTDRVTAQDKNKQIASGGGLTLLGEDHWKAAALHNYSLQEKPRTPSRLEGFCFHLCHLGLPRCDLEGSAPSASSLSTAANCDHYSQLWPVTDLFPWGHVPSQAGTVWPSFNWAQRESASSRAHKLMHFLQRNQNNSKRRNWKCWFWHGKFHCFSGFLWVSTLPVSQQRTLQLQMRVFKAALSRNGRRGPSGERGTLEEATGRANQISLLSEVASLGVLLGQKKGTYPRGRTPWDVEISNKSQKWKTIKRSG